MHTWNHSTPLHLYNLKNAELYPSRSKTAKNTLDMGEVTYKWTNVADRVEGYEKLNRWLSDAEGRNSSDARPSAPSGPATISDPKFLISWTKCLRSRMPVCGAIFCSLPESLRSILALFPRYVTTMSASFASTENRLAGRCSLTTSSCRVPRSPSGVTSSCCHVLQRALLSPGLRAAFLVLLLLLLFFFFNQQPFQHSKNDTVSVFTVYTFNHGEHHFLSIDL